MKNWGLATPFQTQEENNPDVNIESDESLDWDPKFKRLPGQGEEPVLVMAMLPSVTMFHRRLKSDILT